MSELVIIMLLKRFKTSPLLMQSIKSVMVSVTSYLSRCFTMSSYAALQFSQIPDLSTKKNKIRGMRK